MKIKHFLEVDRFLKSYVKLNTGSIITELLFEAINFTLYGFYNGDIFLRMETIVDL